MPYHSLLLGFINKALSRNDLRLLSEHGILITVDHQYLLAFPLDNCNELRYQDIDYDIFFGL
jgi:hypothetical protein